MSVANMYVVTLTMYIGEYEKSSLHLIRAESPKEAGIKAQEYECHNDPDFSHDSGACWDDWMCYRVANVRQIDDGEFNVLARYL